MVIQPLKPSSQKISLRQFHCRPVRDLAWALLSPNLFTEIPDFPIDWFQQDYIDDDVYPWLSALDAEPESLYQHLTQQRSTRLGIYFEQLLSFYFENFYRFTLLAKNLQVNTKQRTLGEFDFIIHDNFDSKTKHIEVAVKFYLGHQNYQGQIKNNLPLHNWHNWVGPNQKDTLAIKMRHLKEHQLTLAKTSWGQHALEKINISGEITSRLLIKGRFYLPTINDTSPPKFNNGLKFNHWVDSINLLKNKSLVKMNLHYCILPRAYWLSPINKNDLESKEITVLTAKELIQAIESDLDEITNEWQVAEIDFLNKDQLETKRFFVVKHRNLPFDK